MDIQGGNDLRTVHVHAGAAIRRCRGTIAAMVAAHSVGGGDPAIEAAGDSEQAVVSLYLASAAAHPKEHGKAASKGIEAMEKAAKK